MTVTAEQARVLACLVEKAETTPDSYPLTTNALVNACNQSTNRNPVVDFSAREVDSMVMELRQLKLARTVTGSGHRVGKHKHTIDEALGLDGHELAVLAILILRGPQTLNEIVTRTERYAQGPDGDRDNVDAAIDRLAGRPDPLAHRLERQPGEREPRIEQTWCDSISLPSGGTPNEPGERAVSRPSGGTASDSLAPPSGGTADLAVVSQTSPPPGAVSPPSGAVSPPSGGLEARVETLERELVRQTQRIDELLQQLGE